MDRINEHMELDAGAVRAALADHPIPPVESVELCTDGIINSNYAVRTDGGRFLLRVYSPRTAAKEPRDPAATAFEVSVLTRLAERGFPSQRPIADRAGRLIGTIGDRPFVLLTFIEGDVLERSAIDQAIAEEIGALLAAMQGALAGFAPAGRKPDADHPLVHRLADDSIRRLRALGEECGRAAERIARDWAELEPLFRDPPLPRGVVHADIYYANIIVRAGRIAGIIDFDDAYLGVQLFDLALVLMEFAVVEEGTFALPLAGAVLRGYTGVRPLGPAEASSLYDAMRFLCFKFLAYTADPADDRGAAAQNPYLRRLDMFRAPALRARFEALLGAGAAP